jgi:hypothetical protein
MPEMKIGLIDVDGHNFPNVALMKISAYHKAQGDTVRMYDPLFSSDCEKIYASKVFTFTHDIDGSYCGSVIKGGTGYNLETVLPDEIDGLYPDYSLYGITDTAYGYLTRGCPRKCDFCIVSQKEGARTFQAYRLSQFYKNQKHIKLLDANITASENCLELFNELAETGASVDFTQGLDLRLLTDEKIEAVKKIKIRRIHFAWDSISDEKIITERLSSFMRHTKYNYHNVFVYVLTNFNSTLEEDLYRIYKIRDMGASPYVMVYEKQKADRIYYRLQRYVNALAIFRSIKSFDEYAGRKQRCN